MTDPWNRLDYSAQNCSVARTLEIVGEKWSLLLMREAFFGLRRFADFERALGCARNILSDRLATLVEHGLLDLVDYKEPGKRTRAEYRLTDQGRELLPAIVALLQWGDRWLADQAGPPVELHHRGCGAAVSAKLVCASGHENLVASDVLPSPGPGALRVA